MIRKVLLLLIAPVVLAACGTAVASGAPSSHPAASASQPASGRYGAPASATPTPAAAAPVAATPAPTQVATPAPPPPAPVVFTAQNMHLGAVLVNGAGRTLYYFLPERGGRVVCTGACTGAWPVLFTTSAAPTANAALPGRLSIVMRAGGDQVTYNNWPLYTFVGDRGPDQTNGQGVFGFGGKWFVATPALLP